MRYLKAITALVTTGIGGFLMCNDSGNGVTENEWAWIVGVTFAATVAVFGVPNSATLPRPTK